MDNNNAVIKNMMMEVKSIIPPKINLSKILLSNFTNLCLLRDVLTFFICSLLTLLFLLNNSATAKILQLSLLAFSFYKQFIFVNVFCTQNEYLVRVRRMASQACVLIVMHFIYEIAKCVVQLQFEYWVLSLIGQIVAVGILEVLVDSIYLAEMKKKVFILLK